jgi:hypothetical protein
MVIKHEGEGRVTIWFLENNERGSQGKDWVPERERKSDTACKSGYFTEKELYKTLIKC